MLTEYKMLAILGRFTKFQRGSFGSKMMVQKEGQENNADCERIDARYSTKEFQNSKMRLVLEVLYEVFRTPA
jgi:hypothetical protein